MIEELCVCGHAKEAHYANDRTKELTWCWKKCFVKNPSSTQWQHDFKLDNLSYIEQLAEEKKLL